MSIAVLVQVYDEVRRLAIAGSGVAAGDFRLKKLIPPLEKAGEKAPVFAKVAQAAAAVVDSNDKTASSALLELTTLVSAILYTQGETGIAGNFAPLETTELGVPITQAGARVVKPLLEALSSTGSGRMELVRDAFERGTFSDLRLVKPALQAIDDPHPEIGQFIADKVLPLYGKAILPELACEARHQGPRRTCPPVAAHPSARSAGIAPLDSVGALRWISRRCAWPPSMPGDSGRRPRVPAGPSPVSRPRTCARRRCGRWRSPASPGPTVIAALKKAIAGTDLELFMPCAKECALAEIQEYVLEQAEQQAKELLNSKDKKEQGKAVVAVAATHILPRRTDRCEVRGVSAQVFRQWPRHSPRSSPSRRAPT